MCLVFFGIIGCLLVILLIAFFVLLKLQKLDKKKIMIAVFGVLLPIFIATAVLAPFAYIDYANGTYPKPPKKPIFYEFYGVYEVEGQEKPAKCKLFEWNIFKNHGPITNGIRFGVSNPDEFDNYITTVESYVSSSIEIRDASYTVFTFSAEGKTWELLKYNDYPSYYNWRNYAVGSDFYKTVFTAKGADGGVYNIFKYCVYNLENSGSSALPYKCFEVDEPAAFEEYLVTVETYSGFSEDETIRTFSFRKDGSVWSLLNYKSNPDVYYWYYEARSSGE